MTAIFIALIASITIFVLCVADYKNHFSTMVCKGDYVFLGAISLFNGLVLFGSSVSLSDNGIALIAILLILVYYATYKRG